MTTVDEQGRPEPPYSADEASTLEGFLDFQRATLAWKCQGLDAAGFAATTARSDMTLGGMMKHLALVEDAWFSRVFLGREYSAPWNAVDWDADRDWDWHSAAADSPAEIVALWQRSVDQARAIVADTVAADGDALGQLAKRPFDNGEVPSLRWIMCHMIEEYARHNGHADLIRESIDGSTGE